MKKIVLALFVVVFVSCNNASETETTTDSSTLNTDTMSRIDNTRLGSDTSTHNDTNSYNRMNDNMRRDTPPGR
jgi:hypothetical protein